MRKLEVGDFFIVKIPKERCFSDDKMKPYKNVICFNGEWFKSDHNGAFKVFQVDSVSCDGRIVPVSNKKGGGIGSFPEHLCINVTVTTR